jgi:chorismate mutase/prephenate dehydratase
MAQVKPCESLEDVFRLVEQGGAHFGMVPIENSLEGTIGRTYDLLLDSPLKVCGETQVRIQHCLIAHPGTTVESIKRVYSHPQALGQCRAYLAHLDFELVPAYDTAGSVKIIKEQGLKDAAIAGQRAAELYGMEVIARDIADTPTNTTRFFAIAQHDSAPTGNDKTSIVFSVKHRPGSLYEFLKDMAAANVNLTKIESRPTRQKAWEYNFYLDFEGHREDARIRQVLENLDKTTLFMKVLGSYPKAR